MFDICPSFCVTWLRTWNGVTLIQFANAFSIAITFVRWRRRSEATAVPYGANFYYYFLCICYNCIILIVSWTRRQKTRRPMNQSASRCLPCVLYSSVAREKQQQSRWSALVDNRREWHVTFVVVVRSSQQLHDWLMVCFSRILLYWNF